MVFGKGVYNMTKILEKIVEPSKIEVGSTFLLKIKAIRYMTYAELKKQKVSKVREYTVAELKGE